MAIGTYELWLDHWDGTRLAYLDSMLELEYTRVLDGVGVINLTMPASFDTSLLQDDYKIEVWRALPKVAKRLENVYLTRGWRKWTDAVGVDKTTIVGVDGNDILKRRLVWTSLDGGSHDRLDDYAGNVAKQLVRNAIAFVDGPGWRDDISTYVSVQPNNNDGVKFAKLYADLILWDAVEKCLNTSAARNGTKMWWYMKPLSATEYEFQVKATQWGQDISGELTISPDNGMTSIEHEYNFTDETNLVWAKGAHWTGWAENYRRWNYAYNKTRIGVSPFAYSEMLIDEGNEENHDILKEAAREEVKKEEHLLKERMTFTLEQTDSLRYGRDWDLGDKISVSYRGRQLKAIIETVYVRMTATELVRVRFDIDVAQDIQTN